MSTRVNTELLRFFKWWLREASSDSPDYDVTAYGLCYLLRNATFVLEFHSLLQQTYGENAYPFGGASQYNYDTTHDTMHLNPKRITFVESQIERLEKLNETI